MFCVVLKNVILLLTLRLVFSETTPSTSTKCLLPNYPQLQNLTFKLHQQNKTIELGSYVEDFHTVDVTCKSGQTLKGPQSLLCQNGGFNHDFPTCQYFCDGKLLDRLSLSAICDNGDNFVKCPQKIAPGSLIQLKCAYGYKSERDFWQNLKCLSNGSFDKVPQPCDHNCGRVSPNLMLLLGSSAEVSRVPWHVGIYRDIDDQYRYLCGGSIVSPTVVISAAHCFWNNAKELPYNSTDFQVIAGSSSRNYLSEQAIQVQELYIPLEYMGRANYYRNDIALVILAKPLKYSEAIGQICFRKELRNTAFRYVMSNVSGFVGMFENNDELGRVPVKTIAYRDCVANDSQIVDDQFCAYTPDSGVMWTGNSGAGFFTASRDSDGQSVYYELLGVVSHLAQQGYERSKTGDSVRIAITNIYHAATFTFKRKVLEAIKKDDLLL